MAIDVEALVGPSGWVTGSQLLQHASRRSLATWVGQGRLVSLGAGRFALPAAAGAWRVRAAAAVEGREAVLSHATALATWELLQHPPGPVHITTAAARSGRGAAGVVVHRSDGAWEDRRRVRGLPVSSVERAVVDTWGRPGGVPATRCAPPPSPPSAAGCARRQTSTTSSPAARGCPAGRS